MQARQLARRKRQIEWPNITGGLIAGLNQASGTDGCFSTDSSTQSTSQYGGGSFKSMRREFFANLSSSVYGKSATVQPPSMFLLPCIKA